MFSIFTHVMSRVTHSEPGLPKVTGSVFLTHTELLMRLSMSSPWGGGVGHRVGILTVSKKKYQNPHPRAKNNYQN